MSRIFEYFVVCGIGPEIRSIDGNKGYHGPGWMYLPSLLDQFPPSTHSLYPPPPPQLSTVNTFFLSFRIFEFRWCNNVSDCWLQCVLPAGVEFHASGFDPNDPSTFPRSYPIVLTGMLFYLHFLFNFTLNCYLILVYVEVRHCLWSFLLRLNGLNNLGTIWILDNQFN